MAAGRDLITGTRIDVLQEVKAFKRMTSERYLISPELFDTRQSEREQLQDWGQSEDSRWWWWQADAWAGKTTAMADLFVNPPSRWEPVAFFVRQRESDTARDFLRSTVVQLAHISSLEYLDLGIDEVALTAQFESLLHDAADAANDAGKHLVMMIDGLDEESTDQSARQSILSTIPRALPASTLFVAASRANPTRIVADHPLWTNRHQLAPSKRAQARREVAVADVRDLLRDDVGRDLGSLLYISGARGLTAQDFAAVSGHAVWRIEEVTEARIGRSFATSSSIGFVLGVDGVHNVQRTAYLWAHTTLREEFSLAMGPALRGQIAKTKDDVAHALRHYAAAKWPEDTPPYLLTNDSIDVAFPVVDTTGALQTRMEMLADASRGAALYRRGESLDQMLSQILDAAAAIPDEIPLEQRDLINVGRLILTYQALFGMTDIPASLGSTFVRLGQPQLGRHLAESAASGEQRSQAIMAVCEALAQAGDVESAIECLEGILEPKARTVVLEEIVRALLAQSGVAEALRFSRQLNDAPTSSRGIEFVARELLKMGRVGKALRIYPDVKFLRLDAESLQRILKYYLERGEVAHAIELLRKEVHSERYRIIGDVSSRSAAAGHVNEASDLLRRAHAEAVNESMPKPDLTITMLDHVSGAALAQVAFEMSESLNDSKGLAQSFSQRAVVAAIRSRFCILLDRQEMALSEAVKCAEILRSWLPKRALGESSSIAWIYAGLAAKFSVLERPDLVKMALLQGRAAAVIDQSDSVDRARFWRTAVSQRVLEHGISSEVVHGEFAQLVKDATQLAELSKRVTELLKIAEPCRTLEGELVDDILSHIHSACSSITDPMERLETLGTVLECTSPWASEGFIEGTVALALSTCGEHVSSRDRAESLARVAEQFLSAGLDDRATTAAERALQEIQNRSSGLPPSGSGVLKTEERPTKAQERPHARVDVAPGTTLRLREEDLKIVDSLLAKGRYEDAISFVLEVDDQSFRIGAMTVVAVELARDGDLKGAAGCAERAAQVVQPGQDFLEGFALLRQSAEVFAKADLRNFSERTADWAATLLTDVDEPAVSNIALAEVGHAYAWAGNAKRTAQFLKRITNQVARVVNFATTARILKDTVPAHDLSVLAAMAVEASKAGRPGPALASALFEVSQILTEIGLDELAALAIRIAGPGAGPLSVEVRQWAPGLANATPVGFSASEHLISLQTQAADPDNHRTWMSVARAFAVVGSIHTARRLIALSWLSAPLEQLDVATWSEVDFDGNQTAPWAVLATV